MKRSRKDREPIRILRHFARQIHANIVMYMDTGRTGIRIVDAFSNAISLGQCIADAAREAVGGGIRRSGSVTLQLGYSSTAFRSRAKLSHHGVFREGTRREKVFDDVLVNPIGPVKGFIEPRRERGFGLISNQRRMEDFRIS